MASTSSSDSISVNTEWLARLRAVHPEGERAMIGYPAIAAWFGRMGWVTREGRPPHWSTVKYWRQKFGLPIAIAPFGRLWTTNYLLSAWALSPGARGLAPLDHLGRLTAPVHTYPVNRRQMYRDQMPDGGEI
jgi:hypothetical protein